MKGFIYIIKNTINKKVYIGQTRVSVDIRWKEHLRHAACKVNKLNPKILNQALQECKSLRSAAKKLGLKYSTFRQACLIYNIEYNSPTSVRH